MTRTELLPSTHLNRDFATLFGDGYSDQEIFSVINFGASFKADNLELQLVLPSHMKSIAGGLAIMQKDMVRKAALGWYDVMPFISRVSRGGLSESARGIRLMARHALMSTLHGLRTARQPTPTMSETTWGLRSSL
jgi:hypothetical protein|eukprot:3498362-Prymnesium_polylepis.2